MIILGCLDTNCFCSIGQSTLSNVVGSLPRLVPHVISCLHLIIYYVIIDIKIYGITIDQVNYKPVWIRLFEVNAIGIQCVQNGKYLKYLGMFENYEKSDRYKIIFCCSVVVFSAPWFRERDISTKLISWILKVCHTIWKDMLIPF